MKKVMLLIALLFSFNVVLAEENKDRVPTSTMTAEPQIIAPYGVASAEFVSTDFVLAEEVFYGPQIIDVEIRSGHQTAALYINLASRVDTKVKIVVSNPELVVSNERLNNYVLYAGTQQSVNMVAFGPHSGTITVLNEEDDVLAIVPYTVRNESEFRHSINGSISLGGVASFSYTLSSKQGWGAGVGIGVDADGNINGSISGSYSW